jgi:hypothetical protein
MSASNARYSRSLETVRQRPSFEASTLIAPIRKILRLAPQAYKCRRRLCHLKNRPAIDLDTHADIPGAAAWIRRRRHRAHYNKAEQLRLGCKLSFFCRRDDRFSGMLYRSGRKINPVDEKHTDYQK